MVTTAARSGHRMNGLEAAFEHTCELSLRILTGWGEGALFERKRDGRRVERKRKHAGRERVVPRPASHQLE
jgi:hypothetical protein